MKIKMLTVVVMASVSIALLACSDNGNDSASTETVLTLAQVTLTPKSTTKKWYFAEQAERGKVIFSGRCAVCHGRNAEATSSWKIPNNNSHYPPPPLNGTAHAWHHPLKALGHTIYNGGAPVGGKMPAFKNQLSESDIVDVIAHIQSYWPNNVYDRWLMLEKKSRK